MSLSAYDQVLYEDHNTRCWDETLNLFEKTAANKSFKETDFIVFMNKSDIFDEKIKIIPFNTYKEDYPKDQINNGESVKKWIQNEFSNRFYHPSSHAKKYNANRGGIYSNKNNGHIVYKNGSNNNEEEKEDIGALQNGKETKRGLHFHITCATDTNQIETVVRCVQIELIRKLMARAALL